MSLLSFSADPKVDYMSEYGQSMRLLIGLNPII